MLEIYKFECFTSPCEVQLYCNDKLQADNCAKDILCEAKRLEKKYNYFDSNSFLHEINSRKTTKLDSETKSLLSRAKQYSTKTEGIFDITMATIKDIYNESATLEDIKSKKELLSKYIGCEHFTIKKDKIYFDNDFTKLDLGGFVKEYSVDRAVTIVKKYKIKSALINFGGDIFAIGSKPNGQKYSVGIT
ncbi:FAD:protein FMN transferase, partial [Arcobacteraceae bacterium]|nr:FAD:protein FMN transferase [Arcobacteraceae bacterium]